MFIGFYVADKHIMYLMLSSDIALNENLLLKYCLKFWNFSVL